jgi:hypothetical protein
MTTAYVRREISATPDAIWTILSDPIQLANGHFGITRIEGQIALGQRIKLWSQVDPKRGFDIKVTAKTDTMMAWHGGLPLGLFTGKRQFTVRPDATSTVFEMRETYHGPLAGLMARLIPDLQPSFDKFGDALKLTAEAKQ